MTKEELVGQKFINQWNSDNVADSEEDAFCKLNPFFLSTSKYYELSEKVDCNDPIDRKEEELLSIIPKIEKDLMK